MAVVQKFVLTQLIIMVFSDFTKFGNLRVLYQKKLSDSTGSGIEEKIIICKF